MYCVVQTVPSLLNQLNYMYMDVPYRCLNFNTTLFPNVFDALHNKIKNYKNELLKMFFFGNLIIHLVEI